MQKTLIEIRLENWGRWSRGPLAKRATSPLYAIMKYYGKPCEEDAEEVKSAPTPNTNTESQDDALTINEAWQRMPLGVERSFLACKYCFNYHTHRLCREFNITRYDLKLLKSRAISSLENCLDEDKECDTMKLSRKFG